MPLSWEDRPEGVCTPPSRSTECDSTEFFYPSCSHAVSESPVKRRYQGQRAEEEDEGDEEAMHEMDAQKVLACMRNISPCRPRSSTPLKVPAGGGDCPDTAVFEGRAPVPRQALQGFGAQAGGPEGVRPAVFPAPADMVAPGNTKWWRQYVAWGARNGMSGGGAGKNVSEQRQQQDPDEPSERFSKHPDVIVQDSEGASQNDGGSVSPASDGGPCAFSSIACVPGWLVASLRDYGLTHARPLQRRCLSALFRRKNVASVSVGRSGRSVCLTVAGLSKINFTFKGVQVLIAATDNASVVALVHHYRALLRASVSKGLSDKALDYLVVSGDNGTKLSQNVQQLAAHTASAGPQRTRLYSLVIIATPFRLRSLLARDAFDTTGVRYFGVHYTHEHAKEGSVTESLSFIKSALPSHAQLMACLDTPRPYFEPHTLLGPQLHLVDDSDAPQRERSTSQGRSSGPETTIHHNVLTRETAKIEVVRDAIDASGGSGRAIVACSTKRKVELVARHIEASAKKGRGKTVYIHDAIVESSRLSGIRAFTNGTLPILVATDAVLQREASRLPRVPLVIGFDFPMSGKTHVGRTALLDTSDTDATLLYCCTPEEAVSSNVFVKKLLDANPVVELLSSTGGTGYDPQRAAEALSQLVQRRAPQDRQDKPRPRWRSPNHMEPRRVAKPCVDRPPVTVREWAPDLAWGRSPLPQQRPEVCVSSPENDRPIVQPSAEARRRWAANTARLLQTPPPPRQPHTPQPAPPRRTQPTSSPAKARRTPRTQSTQSTRSTASPPRRRTPPSGEQPARGSSQASTSFAVPPCSLDTAVADAEGEGGGKGGTTPPALPAQQGGDDSTQHLLEQTLPVPESPVSRAPTAQSSTLPSAPQQVSSGSSSIVEDPQFRQRSHSQRSLPLTQGSVTDLMDSLEGVVDAAYGGSITSSFAGTPATGSPLPTPRGAPPPQAVLQGSTAAGGSSTGSGSSSAAAAAGPVSAEGDEEELELERELAAEVARFEGEVQTWASVSSVVTRGAVEVSKQVSSVSLGRRVSSVQSTRVTGSRFSSRSGSLRGGAETPGGESDEGRLLQRDFPGGVDMAEMPHPHKLASPTDDFASPVPMSVSSSRVTTPEPGARNTSHSETPRSTGSKRGLRDEELEELRRSIRASHSSIASRKTASGGLAVDTGGLSQSNLASLGRGSSGVSTPRRKSEEAMLLDMFRDADADNDGLLNLQEINTLLQRTTGVQLSEPEFRDVLQATGEGEGLTIDTLGECLEAAGGVAAVYDMFTADREEATFALLSPTSAGSTPRNLKPILKQSSKYSASPTSSMHEG